MQIESLFVYPLKSGHAISVDTARLAPTGFEWDRNWMAVDETGTFLSQRTHPRLALVKPAIEPDALVLRAAGQSLLRVPLEDEGPSVPVRVWKDSLEGIDQGELAGAWLSEVVGAPVRLVRVPQRILRRASAEFVGERQVPLSFVDGFPMLVCNRASLDALNERMPEPIPMSRFRPSIVVSGLAAFAEDTIATLQIGEVTLRLVKPCTRCVITSTDQETGERSTNPLPVLRGFRFDRKLMGVTFGENAIVEEGHGRTLSRGQTLSFTTRSGAAA